MSNKKKVILISLGAISILLIVILASMLITSLRQNIVNNENNPTSFPNPTISSPQTTDPEGNTELNPQKITNYISGGSNFYCPNNASICEKIRGYYRNINDKNFDEAYKYGGKLRTYDNLVNTYQNYSFVSASYIKEQNDRSYKVYVTLINNPSVVEYYEVLVTADENSILSSTPTSLGNQFNIDCNYLDNSENSVCVFKTLSNNEIANLFASSFFYLPQFYKGGDAYGQTAYYSPTADGLSKSAIIYLYNSNTKVLTFDSKIDYLSFPDIQGICTGDSKKDNSVGGCVEKYLTAEQVDSNRRFLHVVESYNLDIK